MSQALFWPKQRVAAAHGWNVQRVVITLQLPAATHSPTAGAVTSSGAVIGSWQL